MKPLLLNLFPLLFLMCLTDPAIASGEGTDGKDCLTSPGELSPEIVKFSFVNKSLTPVVAFIDIGCALKWRERLCATDTITFDYFSKVYDFYTSEEVSADKAFYVVESGTETPFHSDIVSFRNRTSAEKLLTEKRAGKIFSYDEIKEMESLLTKKMLNKH